MRGAGAARSGRAVAALAAAVALAALLAYLPALDADFVNWDDEATVTRNPRVRGLTADGVAWAFTTFHAANWHPLTWLSHMADGSLFGLDARGHHRTSVLLHALNAALLLVVLQRLTGDLWPSALVAALFALHPLNVESVAWVSERKNVLSTLFWILVIGTHAEAARRATGGAGAAASAPTLRAAVVVLFALGLMAKPMLVTLPFVLLLLDAWPLRRLSRAAVVEKAPLFALAAVSCVVTLLAQRAFGAVVDTQAAPLGARAANAAVSAVGYLAKAVWPSALSVYYPLPGGAEAPPLSPATVALAAGALAAIAVACVRARRRAPHLLVGWLWFLGTLVPVCGLVQVGGQAMADRYAYVTLIGVFIAVAWSVPWPRVTRREPRAAPRLVLTVVAVIALLASFGARTSQRCRAWRDSEALWTATLATHPESRIAHGNYGIWLTGAGRRGEAIAHLWEALTVDTRGASTQLAEARHAGRAGRHAEALAAYRAARRPLPLDPFLLVGLGAALVQAEERDAGRDASAGHAAAIPFFEEALRQNPAHADARFSLAASLAGAGRFDEAAARFREVVAADPADEEAHARLSFALVAAGRRAEAIRALEAGLVVAPTSAPMANALAWLLATSPEPELRDGARAVALAERAADATGRRDAEALDTLAAAYAEAGRFADARVAAAEALALARAAGDAALASEIEPRLALYERGDPARSGP